MPSGARAKQQRYGRELPADLRDESGRTAAGAQPGWGFSWRWDEQGLPQPAAMPMEDRAAALTRYVEAVATGWQPPVLREQWVGPHHPSEAGDRPDSLEGEPFSPGD